MPLILNLVQELTNNQGEISVISVPSDTILIRQKFLNFAIFFMKLGNICSNSTKFCLKFRTEISEISVTPDQKPSTDIVNHHNVHHLAILTYILDCNHIEGRSRGGRAPRRRRSSSLTPSSSPYLCATIDLLTPTQRGSDKEEGASVGQLNLRYSQLEEFNRRAATKLEGRGGGGGGGARRCRRATPQSPHVVTVFLTPSSRSSALSSDDEEETAARRCVEGEGPRCSHLRHRGRRAKVVQMERSGTSGDMEEEVEAVAKARRRRRRRGAGRGGAAAASLESERGERWIDRELGIECFCKNDPKL